MFEKYGKEFYMSEGESAKRASEILLPYILERLDCRSIIDFGCGTGEWLKIAKNFRGRNKEEVEREITGIDGEYAKDYLQIQEDEFIPFNLCEKIDLNRKYDLAMSLEVAEHLPEDKADIFVDNITKHSDIVLFSAAIPGQGGYEHYNEQHVSYWKEKFAKHGYKMCDCIRKVFWRDDRIDVFYRQNMVLYVKEELKEKVEEVFYTEATIDDMVHPWLWEERVLDKKRYYFPFDKVEKNSKVVIYGAGFIGKEYIEQLLATNYCKVVMWCDKEYASMGNMPVKVSSPQELENIDYDVVVIATSKEVLATSIKKDLEKLNVPEGKMLWKNPLWIKKFL